jgi:acetolactate synthase I/II/III large subunit
MQITGAQLLVKALVEEKTDILFGYPGGYVIQIFDALYEEEKIKLVMPRHEQGLVHAADGYARATGKVGVCLVTSGPGATNTITGLATAYFDSVPLVCLTGQVPSHLIGNDAFQEADIVGMSRSITKHSFIVTDRTKLAETIKKAFYIASTGRPGPVVVDLPVDILKSMGSAEYPDEINIRSYKPVLTGNINQIKKAAEMIQSAKRPLFLIGGGVRISGAGKQLNALVDKTGIPAVNTLQGMGGISTEHPLCVGMLGMHGAYAANKAVGACDVLISIGARFSDRITSDLSKFAPHAKIIHIDIDSASISRNVPVKIPIVGDAKAVIESFIPLMEKMDLKVWTDEIEANKKFAPMRIVKGKEKLSPMAVIDAIDDVFPDALITTDVGQHQMWTTQFATFKKPGTLITSGGLGTMGFGFPAAIGAQLGNPDKRVVSISGDGGFQMNLQELATAVQEELPIVTMVMNNEYLGMVRQWQGLFFDKRYAGTCLKRSVSCPKQCDGSLKCCPKYTPDFVKLAEAYGATGIRVTSPDEIIPALEAAKKNTRFPTLIEFVIEREYNVMPMIPSGAASTDMLIEEE